MSLGLTQNRPPQTNPSRTMSFTEQGRFGLRLPYYLSHDPPLNCMQIVIIYINDMINIFHHVISFLHMQVNRRLVSVLI